MNTKKLNQILSKLTELEAEVLINGILNNDYTDGPNGATWSWAIWECSSIDRKKVSRKQISGVVSSLNKKGIVSSDNGRGNEAAIWWNYEKNEILAAVYFNHILFSAMISGEKFEDINPERLASDKKFCLKYGQEWLGN